MTETSTGPSRPTSTEPGPVHMLTGPSSRWTTVNFAEAIQGVQTPLSWSVWDYGMERACRRAFGALGVLAAREVPPPPDAADRMSGIFYGRAAGNIDFFRRLGDRMPGSSGDVIEEKLLGQVAATPSPVPREAYRRYPVFLAKAPRAVWSAPRRLPGILEEHRAWWRRNTLDAPPADLAAAQRLIRDAAERFANVGVEHTVVSMIGPQFLDTLSDLAEEATGDRSLGMVLATGYGGMEETTIIKDLWACSQGRLELTEIQRRHGFHGPDEGRLDTRSWREDTTPVETILRGYARGTVGDPAEREAEQIRRRLAAQEQILAGLPAHKRPPAKLVMKLAGAFIPAREVGKAAFLHTIDAARCAARAGGAILAEQGILSDPEDVFFLTLDEFTGTPTAALAEVVAERRAADAHYRTLELPARWTGNPAPIVIAPEAGSTGASVSGIGVVGGVVTGRARVVFDPTSVDLDDGDILVCPTTDPSWTPLFMLTEALVIDTGGQMSHGAIVARELGVTCVINTGNGTREIPDGATITVDGGAGTVTIEP